MENDGAGYGGGDDVSPIWKVTEALLRPVTVPTDFRTGGPVKEIIMNIQTNALHHNGTFYTAGMHIDNC